MTLTRDVYRALEDVVGPENISDDPVILDSYARRSGLAAGIDTFVPRFEAIVLPVSTEEVQAIVILCNRYKIQYKASSTGWGFFSDPHGPGVIQLDLRRMNRIIEINEKNMYAVVEPYVIGAELQAELMKRGLLSNVIGAGANCSALPLVGHVGGGHMGQSVSYGERNLLATEWITPDGEIVKLGSLGASDEWFCGDGPGPSLRGIIRGCTTPLGGLGVYTKAATKIYHWPGPPVFPIAGVSPHYAPDQIPEGFIIRYFSFPSFERMYEAQRKVGESEIALELMAFDIAMLASNMSISNEEDIKYLELLRKAVQGPGFLLIIAGNSPGEFEYKQRVLQIIIDETSGKSVELIEDTNVGGSMLWRCIRITASIRETFRATGIFGGAQAGNEGLDSMFEYIRKVSKTKVELAKEGLLLDDGGDVMGWSIEHGHMGHGELLIRHFATPDAVKGSGELVRKSLEIAINEHYELPHGVAGDELHDFFGPSSANYNLWLRKIKKTFDPNEASEASHHITAKE